MKNHEKSLKKKFYVLSVKLPVVFLYTLRRIIIVIVHQSYQAWLMFGVKRTITSHCFTLLSKMQMDSLFVVLLLSYAL